MHVRPIAFGSPEYDAYCDLRHRFLREPLGLVLTKHDVEGEESQHLYGLFSTEPGEASTLIGGLTGKPDDDVAPRADTVRIRQVVVHTDWRRQGCGGQLLLGAERLLAELGYRRYVLFARGEAVEFYERHGYKPTGKKTELIGLEHELMEKLAREAGAL